MKKLMALVVTASFLAAGAAALAGDCCGSGKSSKDEGFNCANACPLAKKANTHRSYGNEGSAAQKTSLACQVQKNLAKI